jgi:hypothetical protein
MYRFLIFIASLFFAFVAISSTATATPSEWRHAAETSFSTDDAPSQGSGTIAAWATVPTPRVFAFVSIEL